MDSLCHPCITTTHLSFSFLSLKLPPPPCAVLRVKIDMYWYVYMYGHPLGPNHVIVSKHKLFYRYWRGDYRIYIYIFTYIYMYIHILNDKSCASRASDSDVWFLLLHTLSPQNPSMELCCTPVEFPPSKGFYNLIKLKEADNWPSHTCHTKRTWKCDPRLTKMDVL